MKLTVPFYKNICLLTDSYKLSQWKQYPPETTEIYSYFESRGGKYEDVTFFGLQYIIKRYLEGKVLTQTMIDEGEMLADDHVREGVFYRNGWEYVLNEHGGRLPVEIMAVPEGTVTGQRNVMMTVRNTDPKCYWLTNLIETLLVQSWYPCTVATQSRDMMKIIAGALKESGTPEDAAEKLHDFGFRGVSSVETAAIGDSAHLTQFAGSDTTIGAILAMQYYGATEVPSVNIPASEHSTMTSWGRDREKEAYENMLDQFPKGPVSVVSDSYDIFHAAEEIWGEQLREKVLGRDGVLVVRPDSGDPVNVLLRLLSILADKFGSYENEKGYRVLNDKVRVIQGDGITFESLQTIIESLMEEGWSIDNMTFGSGGGLLQKMNRDTLRFAFKASNAVVGEEEVEVYKDPITAPSKSSKKGRLHLYESAPGKYTTYNYEVEGREDVLRPVFRNGELLVEDTLSDVRERAAVDL